MLDMQQTKLTVYSLLSPPTSSVCNGRHTVHFTLARPRRLTADRMADRVAVLTIGLSEEASWAEIVAECTAAGGHRILVRLSNAGGASHVAYKCKTNAPRRWSVRPNGGVLAPGEEVDVTFRLCGSDVDTLEDDRHLILSAPVSADQAQRLRDQRAVRPRSSLALPDLDTPRVSQHRVIPRFDVWPASSMLSPASQATPVPASDRRSSPRPSPAVTTNDWMRNAESPPSRGKLPAPPMSVAAVRRGQPVRERVAEIDRRNSTSSEPAWLSAAGVEVSTTGSHEENAEQTSEDVSDGGGSESGRERRHGGLLGALLSLLDRAADEVVPWLSWKVYDVLFALAMLYLAKRVKLIRKAQELDIL